MNKRKEKHLKYIRNRVHSENTSHEDLWTKNHSTKITKTEMKRTILELVTSHLSPNDIKWT